MWNRRLALIFVLSVFVGLIATACAGVAVGRLDVPVAGGPLLQTNFELPSLQLNAAATLQTERALAVEKAVMMQTGHFCNGD